ncbi:MAG TPA: DUF1272 domain-containing protein [Candidatus Dormibacteraeota bacterium]|nr:DUF1272 domain-containing protein [Candidatus Dormibacteraeota bacterium]HEV2477740.1 DUF1272 domain-containing protein [Candidatus Dormibacteraeota bacterium]
MSGLEMRVECERCGAPLKADDVAYICSYECTYCAACYAVLEHRCKNCGGELARRPRRTPEPATLWPVVPDPAA